MKIKNTKTRCHPIVSEEDKDLLEMPWRLHREGYPFKLFGEGKRQKFVLLHRIVLYRKLGRILSRSDICDHINGNKLDARRENLRLVTNQQNGQNRRKADRGVYFHIRNKKWVSRVTANKVLFYLGEFDDRKQAVLAAQNKRRELGFYNGADYAQ